MISEEEIRSIANLAYLKINDNEIEQLRSDFSSILEYMDKLNEIDTSKISGTSNLSKTENVDREDISKRFDKDLLIGSMPKQKNGYLEVKKVLYND
ncbi:MAG: Asp-tRNA(Asn)/Glu-tRNA(Gln) amidotransferase subunit GatC [Candidatus Paceibacterota bacterium]